MAKSELFGRLWYDPAITKRSTGLVEKLAYAIIDCIHIYTWSNFANVHLFRGIWYFHRAEIYGGPCRDTFCHHQQNFLLGPFIVFVTFPLCTISITYERMLLEGLATFSLGHQRSSTTSVASTASMRPPPAYSTNIPTFHRRFHRKLKTFEYASTSGERRTENRPRNKPAEKMINARRGLSRTIT